MPRLLGDKRGFTLTELLVVVAIIVLLTSIVVPNIAGRLTLARMHATEDQIAEIEAALAAYHADFGTYPGDVFPTEDVNNNGKLDTGEDDGVDLDGNGTKDYATVANGRIDHGDGVVNIYDLEWALRTTAKNGPYMDGIPLDPWNDKYVYYAPLTRPTDSSDTLYLNPANITDEDTNQNGKLDAGEDDGIAAFPNISGFSAGAGNGILDHGDDDNKDGTIQRYITASPLPDRLEDFYIEYGNADISPDGLARNLGYYIYSVGRNKKDETATGYEDINLNSILNTTGNLLTIDGPGTFDEDSIRNNDTLDTGYEDTGLDGIPGTKDDGEDDGKLTTGTGGPPTPDEDFDADGNLDIGGDDINSWNKKRPWREHSSYGG